MVGKTFSMQGFVKINKLASYGFKLELGIIINYKDMPILNIFRGVEHNMSNGAQWSIQRNFIQPRGILTPCVILFGCA